MQLGMRTTKARNPVSGRARATARIKSRRMIADHSKRIRLRARRAAEEHKVHIRARARKARKMRTKSEKSDLQKIVLAKRIKPKRIRINRTR